MSNENKKSDNKEQVKLSEMSFLMKDAFMKRAEDHAVKWLKRHNIEASEEEKKELVSRVIKALEEKYVADELAEAARPKNNKVSTWVDRGLQGLVTLTVFVAAAAIANKAKGKSASTGALKSLNAA